METDPGMKGPQPPPPKHKLERIALGGPPGTKPTQFPGPSLWFGVSQPSSPAPPWPGACMRHQGTPDEDRSAPAQEGPKEAESLVVPGPRSRVRV